MDSARARNTAGLGITQLPNANALDVAERVKAEVTRLSQQFPKGLKYEIAFDSTLAVEQSIREVILFPLLRPEA